MSRMTISKHLEERHMIQCLVDARDAYQKSLTSPYPTLDLMQAALYVGEASALRSVAVLSDYFDFIWAARRFLYEEASKVDFGPLPR